MATTDIHPNTPSKSTYEYLSSDEEKEDSGEEYTLSKNFMLSKSISHIDKINCNFCSEEKENEIAPRTRLSFRQPSSNHIKMTPAVRLHRVVSFTAGLHRQTPSLPCVPSDTPVQQIAIETIVTLLNGAKFNGIDSFRVVDCRFKYEYEGGHIRGAVNIRTPKELEELYNQLSKVSGNHAIIFHCEYSKQRGPMTAGHFRKLDRTFNHYPRLSFPDTYVLQGGYKEFWEKTEENRPNFTEPPNYIRMWDPKYVKYLRKENNHMKKHWKKSFC